MSYFSGAPHIAAAVGKNTNSIAQSTRDAANGLFQKASSIINAAKQAFSNLEASFNLNLSLKQKKYIYGLSAFGIVFNTLFAVGAVAHISIALAIFAVVSVVLSTIAAIKGCEYYNRSNGRDYNSVALRPIN